MPKLWSDDGVPVEAVDGKPPRCPRCCTPAVLGSRAFPPGGLAVCGGCSAACRLSEDGRRLLDVDVSTLSPDDQVKVRSNQAEVINHIRSEGLPAGLHWGTGTLCRPCWEEFAPGREPCALKSSPWGTCEFCGCRTDSGIYRRMLVEKPPSESPGAPS